MSAPILYLGAPLFRLLEKYKDRPAAMVLLILSVLLTFLAYPHIGDTLGEMCWYRFAHLFLAIMVFAILLLVYDVLFERG